MASFVPFLVYFMLSWRDHIYHSFLRFFDGPDRVAVSRSLEGVAEMARAFVVGNFMIGILLATVSWAAFAIIHVPYPFLAGILSGFLSLVPYAGMVLALLPPVLSVIAGGNTGAVILIALTIVLTLHLTAMNVLYPKIVGARVHLNPLVVTFSLMFWGFIWDAAGLLLAIPITAGIKAVCDNVAGLRSFGRFLGDTDKAMPRSLFARLKDRARSVRRRIVFAEGDDERVIAAARRLREEGLADPILLSPNYVLASPRLSEYSDFLHRLRAPKGMTEAEAEILIRDPLYFAAAMVATGEAHGTVAGCVNTTAKPSAPRSP